MTKRLLLALATVASVLVGPAASAAGCAPVHRYGHWTRIEYPANALRSTMNVIPAARRGGPDTLFMLGVSGEPANSQQRAILRSDDGGCSWVTAYAVQATQQTAAALGSPEVGITGLSVAPRRGPNGAVLYAVTGDSLATFAVPPPTATIVSTDGGKHWTVHVPSDLTKDVPRCGVASVSTGPDPATAYLHCVSGSLAEAYGLMPVRCYRSLYVTHDYGAIWTPIAPGLTKPGTVAPDGTLRQEQFGCGPAGQGTVTSADRRLLGGLWEVRTATTAVYAHTVVVRSTDHGKTWKPYGPAAPGDTYYFAESTQPSGVPVLLASADNVHYNVGVGGGPWRQLPAIRVPAAQQGRSTTFGLVDETTTVLTVYSDGGGNPRVFSYDVQRSRDWRELPPPPKLNGKPAWGEYSGPRLVTAAGSPSVYIWLWSDMAGIFRYTP